MMNELVAEDVIKIDEKRIFISDLQRLKKETR